MLTPSDVSVLHLVEDCEMDMFTVPELETLSGLGHRKLIESLSRLVSVGSLSRVERGVYCTRNFRNINAIATRIVKDSAIAYWTALNLHGMTEQIPNVVFVQSCNPKADKGIFGVRCKFVRVKKDAYTGIMQMGYGRESRGTAVVMLNCCVRSVPQIQMRANFWNTGKRSATYPS